MDSLFLMHCKPLKKSPCEHVGSSLVLDYGCLKHSNMLRWQSFFWLSVCNLLQQMLVRSSF